MERRVNRFIEERGSEFGIRNSGFGVRGSGFGIRVLFVYCLGLYFSLFALSGCGYSTNALIAPHLKTIAIPLVENQTMRPGLGEALTDSLISAFTRDRHLRVTNIENAHLVLECRITGYNRTPQAYDEKQNVYAYQVTIDANCKAEDKVKSEIVWEEPVSAWITYDPKQESEEKGIEKVIAKLASEIVRRTITSW
uniref:LptE family protein n=1 Tax=candidate division WOR-3 bacterium TaxID=2052148 RepID=A0A7C6EBY9_UNCW3